MTLSISAKQKRPNNNAAAEPSKALPNAMNIFENVNHLEAPLSTQGGGRARATAQGPSAHNNSSFKSASQSQSSRSAKYDQAKRRLSRLSIDSHTSALQQQLLK